ncbi:protein max [Elysia marginata]|uniref:Protein max n=1 Tax=Elysia marginata TaxID=1093978 RepID=A0AAV4EZJ2_9GAST|nr:protein max [Elysia marginata]
MSDEDREIDIESDADDEDGSQAYSSEDKRAHHNALERKRRDHIKDSFHSLRDCVPQDDSKTSRAQILRQAAEYILRMREKTQQNDRHIDILKKQNDELYSQVRSLQKSQAGGKAVHNSNFYDDRDDDDSESYEEETVVSSPPTKRKKIKASS